jgi:predicted NAD-dependent protein-ADP-ribosyltransferase YbiA (DUF1768 family)
MKRTCPLPTSSDVIQSPPTKMHCGNEAKVAEAPLPSTINIVDFYDPKGPRGFCSNFAKCRITFDGIVYKNSEAAYQSLKFAGPRDDVMEYRWIIANARTAGFAAQLGRQKIVGKYHNLHIRIFGLPFRQRNKNYKQSSKYDDMTHNAIVTEFKARGVTVRADWDTYRLEAMTQVLLVKFLPLPSPMTVKLLDVCPPDTLLVEHTKRDHFWGDGGDFTRAGPPLGHKGSWPHNHLGRMLTAVATFRRTGGGLGGGVPQGEGGF